jgi:BioD-like phosphotransacetylase family protein
MAHDRMEEALEKIFAKYEDYKARHDLVVIEGTHEGARGPRA